MPQFVICYCAFIGEFWCPKKQKMWLQILSASKTLLKQMWRRTDLHLHHGPLWLFSKTVKSTPAQCRYIYIIYLISILNSKFWSFTSYIRWILPVRTGIGEWVGRVSNLGVWHIPEPLLSFCCLAGWCHQGVLLPCVFGLQQCLGGQRVSN